MPGTRASCPTRTSSCEQRCEACHVMPFTPDPRRGLRRLPRHGAPPLRRPGGRSRRRLRADGHEPARCIVLPRRASRRRTARSRASRRCASAATEDLLRFAADTELGKATDFGTRSSAVQAVGRGRRRCTDTGAAPGARRGGAAQGKLGAAVQPPCHLGLARHSAGGGARPSRAGRCAKHRRPDARQAYPGRSSAAPSRRTPDELCPYRLDGMLAADFQTRRQPAAAQARPAPAAICRTPVAPTCGR